MVDHRVTLTRLDGLIAPGGAVLLDAPFSALERINVLERRTTVLEHLEKRILSLSGTSPGRIGTSAGEVAQALRDLLSTYAVDGKVEEIVESEALLAFRPGA